jgi:hypothetical protein
VRYESSQDDNEQATRQRAAGLSGTQELPAWKIHITKLQGSDQNAKGRRLVGWEYSSPETGYPYLVYLKGNGVLKTSVVEEVREVSDGLVIKTRNSIYHIAYLGRGYFADEVGESKSVRYNPRKFIKTFPSRGY